MSATKKQVGGDHYKKMKIQPETFIYENGIGWHEGTAIKYLCRWRDKGGVDDLDKAIHIIELLKEKQPRPIHFTNGERVVIHSPGDRNHGECGVVTSNTKHSNPLYIVKIDDGSEHVFAHYELEKQPDNEIKVGDGVRHADDNDSEGEITQVAHSWEGEPACKIEWDSGEISWSLAKDLKKI